jgi:hypothetical protein
MSCLVLAALVLGMSARADGPQKPGALTGPDVPPVFTARAVRVVGDRLEVVGIDDPAGRVRVYADGNDSLSLWAVVVGRRMERATPFLGEEGPGRNIAEMKRERPSGDVPLGRPVVVALVTEGASGAARQVRAARITSVRFCDN